jgi:hypothetical protein
MDDPNAARRAGPGTVVKVSGTLILRHLEAFRTEVGRVPVERALAAQPEEVRHELETLVPGAWFDTRHVDDLYRAIADEAGEPMETLLPRAFERGNRETMSTVWRALLRMAPDRIVLSRVRTVFEKSYSHGVVSAELTDDGGRVVLTHWPGIENNRLIGLAAGIQAALRLRGHTHAQVSFERHPDGAVFNARF